MPGNKGDKTRIVKFTVNKMKTVALVKRLVKKLAKAPKDKWEMQHQTMLIMHDNGLRATMPDYPEEAQEVERSCALRQGGLRGERAEA